MDRVLRMHSRDLESVSTVPRRTFQLRGVRVCFVTWNHSQVEDHNEFYRLLRAHLPSGTELFGGQERHADGSPHYHVVIRFSHAIHWKDARKELMLELETGEIDTQSIRIERANRNPKLGPVETDDEFLERTQAYSSKDRNQILFGDWIDVGQHCNECEQVVTHRTKLVCLSCVEERYKAKVSSIPDG